MIFTRAIRQAFRVHNFAVLAAREEYYAHPHVALEEDWCEACDNPRAERQCHVCTAHMAVRGKRKRGAA